MTDLPLDEVAVALDAPNASRVTIHDVAREAGVSVATVSKVVNGRYGVAPATAAQVMTVVEKLGYESSIVASSLRRGSTNVIGILLGGFEPFSTEILKGISAHALGRDYQLLAYSGAIADDREVGWERRSVSRLAGTLIDGAIIVTPTVTLPRTKMPIVAIDPYHDPDGPPFVDCDSEAGARAATEYLLELGHTKIGHIRGRLDLESALVRERAWRQALLDAGIDPNPAWIRDGGYRREWAYEVALEMLQQNDRPTAIFAANDQSAFGVIDAAHELGIMIPEQLSVIGFDDIPEAAMAEPRLTTVAQPLQEIGAKAFDMVIDMLKGKHVEQHIRVPARVVKRGTTGPAPLAG
ncbi:MAG: LacI family transcriptional regulator [Cellulomonadaceae bacterium]|jgi:LacI family transcriptional regulator|nr:LacI family transcriptional regulator [Cellulomonadaceae bacterium]